MGNAGNNESGIHHSSAHHDRHHRHSKNHHPPSPGKEPGAGQAFVFDKKNLLCFNLPMAKWKHIVQR